MKLTHHSSARQVNGNGTKGGYTFRGDALRAASFRAPLFPWILWFSHFSAMMSIQQNLRKKWSHPARNTAPGTAPRCAPKSNLQFAKLYFSKIPKSGIIYIQKSNIIMSWESPPKKPAKLSQPKEHNNAHDILINMCFFSLISTRKRETWYKNIR